MTVFYDHIIQIHHIHSEIEELSLSKKEKMSLIDTIEEIVHHKIIHRIRTPSALYSGDHGGGGFNTYPDDHTILDYLKRYVPDIEDHISEAAEEVKFDMLKTIRNS